MSSLEALFVIAAWGGVWWWVARRLVASGKSRWISHLGGLSVGFVGAMVASIPITPDAFPQKQPTQIATATTDNEPPPVMSSSDVKNQPSELSEEKAAPTQELDLGMTPKQFSDDFNSKMKTVKLPYRVKPTVNSGMVNDTFSAQLNNLISFVGAVSKTSGKMQGAMVIAGGDGSPKSGLESMLVGTAIFAAALPDVDQQQIGPLALKLVKDASEATDSRASSILNGVRLSYTRSDVMGNVFSAEIAK